VSQESQHIIVKYSFENLQLSRKLAKGSNQHFVNLQSVCYLLKQDDVLSGLWFLVFHKINSQPDVLYYFLGSESITQEELCGTIIARTQIELFLMYEYLNEILFQASIGSEMSKSLTCVARIMVS
jgi:hypothetical protein